MNQTIWIERLVEENNERKWKLFQEIIPEEDFSINEENLNAEIGRMGYLLARYGELSAQQTANLKRKEEQVKLIKAKISAALRSEAETEGTKLTENKLEEQVISHKQYQQVLEELHILRANVLKSENYWKTIMKKSDLLVALAYRQSAELKRMPG